MSQRAFIFIIFISIKTRIKIWDLTPTLDSDQNSFSFRVLTSWSYCWKRFRLLREIYDLLTVHWTTLTNILFSFVTKLSALLPSNEIIPLDDAETKFLNLQFMSKFRFTISCWDLTVVVATRRVAFLIITSALRAMIGFHDEMIATVVLTRSTQNLTSWFFLSQRVQSSATHRSLIIVDEISSWAFS
jgi:hypothetical protein